MVVGGSLHYFESKLEIYDVTACLRRNDAYPNAEIPNCLDDAIFTRPIEYPEEGPLMGMKFLSTAVGNQPRVGVPPDPGMARKVETIQRRAMTNDGVREDQAIAYVNVVPLGIVVIDVVDAVKVYMANYGKQNPAFDRWAIDSLTRGSFFDLGVVKNTVAAAEEPTSGAGSRLRLYDANMISRDDIYLPRTFRAAVGANFLFDVDGDGNLGLGEDEDDDNGDGRVDETDRPATDEFFDLAVVANGGLRELYVIDLSDQTDLAHDEALSASDSSTLSQRVISRIELPGSAFNLCVDAATKLAYAEVTGQGLAVVDLSHILGVIKGEINGRALIDGNNDGLDDRILHIFQTADYFQQGGSDPHQYLRGLHCVDAEAGPATGLPEGEADPRYSYPMPGNVYLDWEITGPEVLGLFDLTIADPIFVRQDVDVINNLTCEPEPEDRQFQFTVSHPATVTVKIDDEIVKVDAAELRTGKEHQYSGETAVAGIPYASGTYTLPIPLQDLPGYGDYTYEFTLVYMEADPAVAGSVDVSKTVTGTLVYDLVKRATLPIGHTMVEGVDIVDGHLTHSAQDLRIPGLGGLDITLDRSYSSAGTDSGGVLGAGWNYNLAVRLERDNCGRVTVIGGEGTGNTFVNPAPDPAKAALYTSTRFDVADDALFYRPQIGYHSTLIEDPDDADPEKNPSKFDFITKTFVRYHFEHEKDSAGRGLHAALY